MKKLSMGTLTCPKHGVNLDFEIIGTMRVKRPDKEGKLWYEAFCHRCGEYFKIEANNG